MLPETDLFHPENPRMELDRRYFLSSYKACGAVVDALSSSDRVQERFRDAMSNEVGMTQLSSFLAYAVGPADSVSGLSERHVLEKSGMEIPPVVAERLKHYDGLIRTHENQAFFDTVDWHELEQVERINGRWVTSWEAFFRDVYRASVLDEEEFDDPDGIIGHTYERIIDTLTSPDRRQSILLAYSGLYETLEAVGIHFGWLKRKDIDHEYSGLGTA